MFGFFKKRQVKSQHFEKLSSKLEEKKSSLLQEIGKSHSEVSRWANKKGLSLDQALSKGARGLAAGAATSAILFAPVLVDKEPQTKKEIKRQIGKEDIRVSMQIEEDRTTQVKDALQGVSSPQEAAQKLSSTLNIKLKTELEGKRLNTNKGIIGYESHLTRYPGESLANHFQTEGDFKRFSHASMAGGPGAFGYLAPSKEALTEKEIERERYYLVVQTFLSPNWGGGQTKAWFRHRKMAVVNPKNGKVVIGALEDAGPEPWTGRKFGGSPEVMEELGFRGGGSEVFMFFVDDPNDSIGLGPK